MKKYYFSSFHTIRTEDTRW